MTAAVKGQKAIALGNVVGSNIANIGLILGICCIARMLTVQRRIIQRELPIMVISAFLLYASCIDLVISRLEGALFLFLFFWFCYIAYRGARTSGQDAAEMDGFKCKRLFERSESKVLIVSLSLFFLLLVMTGAHLMVQSAALLASLFGVSPWLIGITVFAIGTSLPELAASLTAAYKKVPSISIGNIVGSNIFNILFVLGVVALIHPIVIQASIMSFELPVLLVFSVALAVFMRTGYRISRLEGVILLGGYAAFFVFLLIR